MGVDKILHDDTAVLFEGFDEQFKGLGAVDLSDTVGASRLETDALVGELVGLAARALLRDAGGVAKHISERAMAGGGADAAMAAASHATGLAGAEVVVFVVAAAAAAAAPVAKGETPSSRTERAHCEGEMLAEVKLLQGLLPQEGALLC